MACVEGCAEGGRVTQLDLFPTATSLSRVDPTANSFRFYSMAVSPDLFGGHALVRRWGRLGSSVRQRIDLFPDEPSAIMALRAWEARKRRRGYS